MKSEVHEGDLEPVEIDNNEENFETEEENADSE